MLGDVGDEPFQESGLAVRRNATASFLPNALGFATGRGDAVLELVRPIRQNGFAHFLADPVTVFRVDELRVRDLLSSCEFPRRVARQGQAAFTGEFHRPFPVVAEAVHQAWQMAQQ